MLGEMLYVPGTELDMLTKHGSAKELGKEQLSQLREVVENYSEEKEAPVKVNGTVSYVEQTAWM